MVQDPLQTDVLIVGGGHAGAACAAQLRRHGFEGSVTIATDEAELPYERPPLSKAYLSREKTFDRLLIRPETFWADNKVEIVNGCRVNRIDSAEKVAHCTDDRAFRYGQMVWAAGGSARRLTCEGADLAGVHTIRTRADVDRLMAELDQAKRAVIIGGGYIGLEATAVLSKFDCEVVLLEAEERLLARVAGEDLSRFFEEEHRRHGVDIRLGESAACITGSQRAEGVELQSGDVLPTDVVIVGIGIEPNIAPLLEAGAEASNGVDVDQECRTSLPSIFAIGDCARFETAFSGGRRVRIESVQNAHDQAAVVAKLIAGKDASYTAIPWFWSDQYDLKLQTMGLNHGFDEAVLRGDPADRSFSVGYFRGDKLVALDAVNAPRDYVQSRQRILDGEPLDKAAFADPSWSLKG